MTPGTLVTLAGGYEGLHLFTRDLDPQAQIFHNDVYVICAVERLDSAIDGTLLLVLGLGGLGWVNREWMEEV